MKKSSSSRDDLKRSDAPDSDGMLLSDQDKFQQFNPNSELWLNYESRMEAMREEILELKKEMERKDQQIEDLMKMMQGLYSMVEEMTGEKGVRRDEHEKEREEKERERKEEEARQGAEEQADKEDDEQKQMKDEKQIEKIKTEEEKSSKAEIVALPPSTKPPSTRTIPNTSFLYFDPDADLWVGYKSRIYCSLVALVKEGYPFDEALQDRAVHFLKKLEPTWKQSEQEARFVIDLVPSSTGSLSEFIESILTLLSSPHSTVVAATISLLKLVLISSSLSVRLRFLEADFFTNVFATVQPHTLPMSGNEILHTNLVETLTHHLLLSTKSLISNIGIRTAVDLPYHRDLVFQMVVLPSSQYLTFLCSNRHLVDPLLFTNFMDLLCTLIRICPYHHPTLGFILASPIVMAFSSCLSSIEDISHLNRDVTSFCDSMIDWNRQNTEVVSFGALVIESMFAYGFEDSLEQLMKHTKKGIYGNTVSIDCHTISSLLGWNVEW
ncbi:hypothetical protein BLNAU_3395 [Blattamonas nauphoetae]|uniref:Uncharacterized protein n=1 Tax=Blattamonas nauphoetae TaxID=2049346 RepID=A0ABQ9YCX5_9EUKA|nr:hypothetical protein BLNAU_3395 [Blattamonas nauphoetae]